MVSREVRQDLLLEAGLALSSELSLPAVLQRIVDLARRITGARYGALGVLGPDREIQEFITSGVDEGTRRAIGHYPTGRGILGVLIEDASPLRLEDISRDPRSVGFPAHHPPMTSFLGAPVKALGRVYGNIYLTEKLDAPAFTPEDEEDVVVLATQAGVAVANAHLYGEMRQRERWLAAVTEITSGIRAGSETERVLAVTAARARELVGADVSAVATVRGRGDSLRIVAADGVDADHLLGMEAPSAHALSEIVSGSGDDGARVVVALSVRREEFGALAVANRSRPNAFDDDDVRLVTSLAEQASLAIEYARVQEELNRLMVMEDRERIAKDLHDGVIQSLFAVGMGLQGTAMLAGDKQIASRIEGAVADLDRVIRDLRNYIFGLRPGILADRQLGNALRELAEDIGSKNGITTVVDVDEEAAAELASRAGDLVQLTREALSNVARHAGAATCRVSLRRDGTHAVLEIDDDGTGFDLDTAIGIGDGLGNLQARADALGGKLEIESSASDGTLVRVTVPV
jgi:signal transduction histidine kinase